MFKKILWPTDFSDYSFKALEAAVEVATKFSSELYIMHVVSPATDSKTPLFPAQLDAVSYREKMKEIAERSLAEIIAEHVPKTLVLHQLVVFGNPAHEILRFAEEQEEIDLIVIATHGKSGFKRFILGSVTERVVRHAGCAVLKIGSKSQAGAAPDGTN